MKILFILAFFSVAVYLITRKLNSKIVTGGLIFLFFGIFGYYIPLSESNEIFLDRIISNLAPATLFLYLLNVDIKRFLKNGIGCSCEMGAKRYWLIVFSALAASFTAQIVAYALFPQHSFLTALVLSGFFGVFASFTPLSRLYGTEDVATTMLYLLLAAFGMRIF